MKNTAYYAKNFKVYGKAIFLSVKKDKNERLWDLW